ncbi:MAG: hypothetical protein F4X99_10405 [Gammaproteobacteria bacterium]|nr:hypothetical protein [Gammaproteobacteria bacterium]
MADIAHRPWGFWLLALLWLPAGLVAQAAFRFGGWVEPMMLPALLAAAGSLVVVAPCGLPLALACRRLWRLGHARAAWGSGIGLGLVTILATLVAGLLGPITIIVYAVVLSLPVWIAALVLARRRQRGAAGTP